MHELSLFDIAMRIFQVLGGLALFIYGMQIMTEGLRIAAGNKLRKALTQTTQNRFAGLSLGTALGITVQSSAATVMLVGFINAGLMTLAQSVPVMLGANIGTTLAMQLISFKLGAYCFVLVTVGFIIQMTATKPSVKACGKALMGFGVLFLGMNLMSGAISDFKPALKPLLTRVDGGTLSGLLLGVLLSTGITAIIQSSGATIAMAFAMIGAGVITSLEQAYPIILGANVGTCMTAILGSIGTNIEARRSAASHLTFNLFSCAFGIVTAPLFYRFIPLISGDLTHQAAHANTIKMALSAALILPIYPLFAKWVVKLTPSRTPPPEPSFLDESLVSKPEQAIAASILELRRVARICAESLQLNANLMQQPDTKTSRRIVLNEQSINAIKQAMNHFLLRLTSHYLSKRQAILLQHVQRCMAHLERIGDHVDRLRELTEARAKIPQAVFDNETYAAFFSLFASAGNVLKLVIESLDPERKDFQEMARSILASRDHYMTISFDCKALCNEKVASQGIGMSPTAAVFLVQYIETLDRIVRHAKTIALVESQPQFWIKRKKLNRIVSDAPAYAISEAVDVKKYIDMIRPHLDPDGKPLPPLESPLPPPPSEKPAPETGPSSHPETDFLDKLQSEDYL